LSQVCPIEHLRREVVLGRPFPTPLEPLLGLVQAPLSEQRLREPGRQRRGGRPLPLALEDRDGQPVVRLDFLPTPRLLLGIGEAEPGRRHEPPEHPEILEDALALPPALTPLIEPPEP